MLTITFRDSPFSEKGHALYCSTIKDEICFFDINGMFFSFNDEENAAKAVLNYLNLHYHNFDYENATLRSVTSFEKD